MAADSEQRSDPDGRRGVAALFAGYTIWGALPIYLRALRAIPAPVIIAYRLVLCCVCVLALLRLRGELSSVLAALSAPSSRRRLTITAVLISINWLVYVWAVSQGRVSKPAWVTLSRRC